MNLIKVLHETAMEFVDFADRAKRKGDMLTYTGLVKKAYLLEKEAALKLFYQAEMKTNTWRFILLRSAGWLAMQSGNLEEAAYLAKLGLSNEPPVDLKKQFDQLLKEITANLFEKEHLTDTKIDLGIPIQIRGILTQANAEQKEIYLQDPNNQQIYLIHVPEELLNSIVKAYWSSLVTVEGRTNPLGIITLEKIQLAA